MTVVDPLTGHQLWAEVYDTVPNPLLSLEERELSKWLGNLHGLCVADVGCGTGRWMERARSLGARLVLGVDFSPNMLAQAAQKPGLQSRVVLAHAAALPLKTCSVDIVICGFALGYFPDLRSVAIECGRILKSNGSLFCSDFHPSAYQRGWKRVFRKNGRTIEIESRARQANEIVAAFHNRQFRLERHADLHLGEPERSLFEAAGKLEFFNQVKGCPAVILFEWRKR